MTLSVPTQKVNELTAWMLNGCADDIDELVALPGTKALTSEDFRLGVAFATRYLRQMADDIGKGEDER